MTKINKLMTSDLQYCTVLDNVYEAAVKMNSSSPQLHIHYLILYNIASLTS